MSQSSSLLALPYIQAAQAQKHVTHNEALRILDAVVQLSVAGISNTPPPRAPLWKSVDCGHQRVRGLGRAGR